MTILIMKVFAQNIVNNCIILFHWCNFLCILFIKFGTETKTSTVRDSVIDSIPSPLSPTTVCKFLVIIVEIMRFNDYYVDCS